MANETAMVKPANQIIYDRTGIHVQTKKVENATSMYPGRYVIRGTNDDDVVVATAGSATYGWLGYEDTIKKHRPANEDTIYVINAQVAVCNGPGVIFVASLLSGQNVTKGARLTVAAAGELTAATAAAIPSGTTAVTSSSAQPTVAGPLPTAGIVVAIAEESVDASSGAADILVRSLI